jgi:hypothetical protein
VFYMINPSHLPWFGDPNNTLWSVQVMNLSLCSLLQPPFHSPFLRPNIPHTTIFSDILICSSLCVRDQVWHPYQTNGCPLMFTSLTCVMAVELTRLCCMYGWQSYTELQDCRKF